MRYSKLYVVSVMTMSCEMDVCILPLKEAREEAKKLSKDFFYSYIRKINTENFEKYDNGIKAGSENF